MLKISLECRTKKNRGDLVFTTADHPSRCAIKGISLSINNSSNFASNNHSWLSQSQKYQPINSEFKY